MGSVTIRASTSIVMPIRNEQKYLAECLESIIAQSDPDWELIAIDDHSNDQTAKILSEFAARDARIKVRHNREKGIIPALQLAYQQTQGKFITRMDADDIMAPQKIELMKKWLHKSGPGHVCSGLVEYFSTTTLGAGFKHYQNWLNHLSIKENHFSDIYKECVIPSPCWMMRKEDFIASGGFKDLRYPEDYHLCFRWYRDQLKVVSPPEILHRWRDHPERSSRTDENYLDQNFYAMKLHYFLELEHTNQPIVIWGVGKKGKAIARLLKQMGYPFQWVCNNPNKIGKIIEGVIIQHYQTVLNLVNPQIIVAVSAPAGKVEIQNYLSKTHLLLNENYYFFY